MILRPVQFLAGARVRLPSNAVKHCLGTVDVAASQARLIPIQPARSACCRFTSTATKSNITSIIVEERRRAGGGLNRSWFRDLDPTDFWTQKAKEKGIPFEEFNNFWLVLFERYTSLHNPLSLAQMLRHGPTYNQDIREKEEHLMQHRQKHNLKFHTHASIARLANDPIKLQVATFLLAQRTLSEAFHTRQRGGKVIATSKLHQTQCYWNVAISLSSLEAAVEFYHWSQVPDFKELQAETGSPIQDNAAKDLIRNAAQAAIENEGECHWEVVAAYLDIDFNVDDISKRSSVEIKQAIELLRRSRPEKKMGDLTDLPFLEQVKVIFDIAPKSKPKPKSKSKTADFFDLLQTTTATSPCHYMLDLIRESLAGNGQISRARRQPLSAQEREKLHVLRDEALEELREISDPKACFILALRDHDVGSDGWVHNMQHAAVRYSEATNEQTSEEMLIGNPSACWLLASHSCEVALEGGDTITKLNRACTAAQWARECIMSYGAPTSSHALRTSTSSSHCITIRYTGSSKAIGTEIVRRIVAMAAWSKLHDDQGVLRRASADCEDWVKSKGLLSSKMSRKLGEYLRDVPGWNNTQCEKWLDDAMNLDRELMNVEALDEVKWYFEGYKDADTQPP